MGNADYYQGVCKCSVAAVWLYAPGNCDQFYCAECVPRGCSCNIDSDGTETFDLDGRQLPCCEYLWIGPDE